MFMPMENNELEIVIERLGDEILKIDNELIKVDQSSPQRNALIYIRQILPKNVNVCEMELAKRKNQIQEVPRSR